MREHENKRAGAPGVTTTFGPPECFRLHRNFGGMSCPWCGLAIPVFPIPARERAKYVDATLYIGSRRAEDPAAEIANPITERETALDKERADLAETISALKWRLSRGDDRPKIGSIQTVISALTGRPPGAAPDEDTASQLVMAEVRLDRVNAKLRSERAMREGRLKAWRAKHPAR